MALIKCPECGKEISDKARRCVHCGVKRKKTQKRKLKKSAIIVMSSILVVLLGTIICFNLFSTSNANKSVLDSTHLKVDGIYVDESFEDDDFALVYLFYTVKAEDTNMKISSGSMNMNINENEYQSEIKREFIPIYTNYYYGDVIKDVYVGKEFMVCSTIKVVKGDLSGSKTITLSNDDVDDIDTIKFSTDDIKSMSSLEAISEDLDKEVYEKKYQEEQDKMSKLDSNLENIIKKELNESYVDFYVPVGQTTSKYKIEFYEPNSFVVDTGLGLSNDGVYDLRKGVIILNFSTGGSNKVYYKYENNEVYLLEPEKAFQSYVKYDPLAE